MVVKIYAIIDKEDEFKEPQYCLLLNMLCLDGIVKERKMGVKFCDCKPEIGNIEIVNGGIGYVELKGSGNDVEDTFAYPVLYIKDYKKTKKCDILDINYGGRSKFYRTRKYQKSYSEYMNNKQKTYAENTKEKDSQIKRQYDGYKNKKVEKEQEKRIEDLFNWS